jgi:hypothetical protein
MNSRLAFDRLVHSDWSVSSSKRWTAVALRTQDGWVVNNLEPTPPPDDFLDFLFDPRRKTLAGFDFPIGLPKFYLDKMKVEFYDLISEPASDRSRCFFALADTLFDISPAQPFYRSHPRGGRHVDLLRRLECTAFNDLLRECDKKTAMRARAESLFWTVGAKQVGKAALAGWREILVPAIRRQARLWPFDGRLSSLDSNVLTLAETYPGEAYQHIGIRRIVRKRSQEGRKTAGQAMLTWASKHTVEFAPIVGQSILDGFGNRPDGEDPFDAVAGLCAMVEVADGHRDEAPDLIETHEGWILGQIDAATS